MYLRVNVHPLQTGSVTSPPALIKNLASSTEKTRGLGTLNTYSLLRFFVVTVLPRFATLNRTVAFFDLILEGIKRVSVILKESSQRYIGFVQLIN